MVKRSLLFEVGSKKEVLKSCKNVFTISGGVFNFEVKTSQSSIYKTFCRACFSLVTGGAGLIVAVVGKGIASAAIIEACE